MLTIINRKGGENGNHESQINLKWLILRPSGFRIIAMAGNVLTGRATMDFSRGLCSVESVDDDDDDDDNGGNNSIQFFIINVPSKQLQCQLQTQHNVDINNSIKDRHKIKTKAT
jgi:hypothetical protein